jgi:hypothetical protein
LLSTLGRQTEVGPAFLEAAELADALGTTIGSAVKPGCQFICNATGRTTAELASTIVALRS